MGNAITQETQYLWIMLCKDGGWWTANMLRHHWRPTFAPHEVQQALDALESRGFIASRDQLNVPQYAFTSDCKLLPGFEVAPSGAL